MPSEIPLSGFPVFQVPRVEVDYLATARRSGTPRYVYGLVEFAAVVHSRDGQIGFELTGWPQDTYKTFLVVAIPVSISVAPLEAAE